MPTPIRAKASRLLLDARLLSAERLEYSWAFDFGVVALTTETHWRVVSSERLLLMRDDDGLKYGLPEPIDAEARLGELLQGRRVVSAEVGAQTADLVISFENGLRLEVLTRAMGYEAWQINSDGSCIVAMGGQVCEHVYVSPGVMMGGPWE